MAGLLPWMAIQEGISRSASVLIDNAAMVKKTVFPLETLVLSVVVAAVVNELIALVGLRRLRGAARASVGPGGSRSLVPALLLQILLTFGLGCIAATLTTILRDTSHAVGIVLTVGFYATPIVYPALAGAGAIPAAHRGQSDRPPGRAVSASLHAAHCARSRLRSFI